MNKHIEQKYIDEIVKSYEDDEIGYTLDDKVLDVAIYVRVSTSGQTTSNQIMELAEVCERNKWHITDVYNETVSGTKSINERQELRRLLEDASRKKFSMVVVWDVSRVGRSLKHLVNTMTRLDELSIDVYAYKQGIQTNTSFGSMFFNLMGCLSQMENDIRKERQLAGIKRAKSQGVVFGRKDVIDEDKELSIVELRHKGKSIRYIANKVGISVGRTHQVCSSMSM